MASDFSIRQVPDDLWVAINTASANTVIMEGEPLSPLAEGEARDAVDLLNAGEITPDA